MISRSRVATAFAVAVSLAVPLTQLPSAAHSEPQAPKVTVKLSSSALTVGDTLTIKVTVKRGAARQKVALQQRRGSKWKSVVSKRLPKKGAVKRVTFTSVPQSPALYRFRVKLKPLGSVRGATSDMVRARVSAPVVPPPPYVPRPLRLDLRNAAGLALPQTLLARSGTGMASAKATTTGLQAVTANGTTYPAISAGSADVRRFLIAPNGRVYVLFRTRVNLADTSVPYSPSGCLLAEVDPATGVPTCIDSSLQYIQWMPNRNPPIQFDASGAIFYLDQASSGSMVLRRYKDGYTSDLINDNVMLSNFLVLPDGSVVVGGQTSSSNVTWTRRISSNGAVKTLLAKSSSGGITAFPDGNVYLANDWRVDRLLTGTGEMDALPWVTSSRDTSGQHEACPEPYSCAVQLNRSTRTSDGRVYAPDGSAPIQVFPTVSPVTTSAISTVHLMQAAGEHLLIAGTNASGAHVLASQHPVSGERVFLGAGSEIEIYHLSLLDADTVWFDGLRFADNRVVVGQIELSTGAVTVGATVEGKWEDFQVFAR